MANNLTLVTITPYSSGGESIVFALCGDSTYGPATGGTGGWQIVDRPKMVGATQWYDRSPMELDMSLLISGEVIYSNPNASVEHQCRVVDGWQEKIVGQQQPPVLTITGPVPGTQHQWCIYQLTFKEALRDPTAGFRIQQTIDMKLYEYNSPLQATLNAPTPTAAFFQNILAQSGESASYLTYTVVAGDTLASIAAVWLNNYMRWTDIANLNNIRDPNSISPGQVILLPQS